MLSPGAGSVVTKKAGTLDTTFGGTGVVTFPVGPGINHASAVASLKDGSVILMGEAEKNIGSNSYQFKIGRASCRERV